MTKKLSRRAMLATTAAAATVPAVAAAVPTSATPDPLVTLWARYQDVFARIKTTEAQCTPLEDDLERRGLSRPRVQIGTFQAGTSCRDENGTSLAGKPMYAYSREDIQDPAAMCGMTIDGNGQWVRAVPTAREVAKYKARLAEFERSRQACDAECERVGLMALYERHEALENELAAIGEALRSTPAITLAGLVVKLHHAYGHIGTVADRAASDRDADWEILLMRGAIADAERLAGKAV